MRPDVLVVAVAIVGGIKQVVIAVILQVLSYPVRFGKAEFIAYLPGVVGDGCEELAGSAVESTDVTEKWYSVSVARPVITTRWSITRSLLSVNVP